MKLIENLSVINLLFLCRFWSILVLCLESNEYYPEEKNSLLQLKDSITSSSSILHQNWTGPPCINSNSRWVGIVCSNGHVVHIVLEGIELKGLLPPSLLNELAFLSKLNFKNNTLTGPLPIPTNLVNLEYVFLSHNQFWNSIPMVYTQLPKLKELELQENYLDGEIPPFHQPTLKVFNVSYNSLQGSIPQTYVLQRFPMTTFDHNPGLCGSPLRNPCPVSSSPSQTPTNPPRSRKSTTKVWSIVLIAGAATLVPFLVILGYLLCCYRKVHDNETIQVNLTEKEELKYEGIEFERTVELEFFDKEMHAFDLDDLLRASAEELGKGKVGTTYKTMLESGYTVAVKRLKHMNGLSKKEFTQQMQLLGRLEHENLVKLVSFYYYKEEKLVIYEFVTDKTLFELLHKNRRVGRLPLNWAARLSIIKGIAKGLVFLHQSLPSQRVPHANLKSSNVLINVTKNYHSRLTNFGFLSLISSKNSLQKLAIANTPEFTKGKNLSHKTDVYCFGIILLEIITGRIPGEISQVHDDEIAEDLSDWVRTVVNYDWSTDILDIEILAAKEGHNEMLMLTQIALHCTDIIPEKRPKMTQILQKIQEIELRYRENHLSL